jgi:hypothetical protein
VPHYNLDDVRNAAKNGYIEYRGRKTRRDIGNLGYELADVVTCLLSLTSSDFYKSYRYDNGDIDDAYRTNFALSNSTEHDSIYIKFSLINDCLMIDLASFHLNV